jgi:hypothetical protein
LLLVDAGPHPAGGLNKPAPNKISLKYRGLLFADDRAVNASFLG